MYNLTYTTFITFDYPKIRLLTLLFVLKYPQKLINYSVIIRHLVSEYPYLAISKLLTRNLVFDNPARYLVRRPPSLHQG